MEYKGFSWYSWLKFKYLLKEKTKLNLEKMFVRQLFMVYTLVIIKIRFENLTRILHFPNLKNFEKDSLF